jgi:hypothetical protein
VAGFHVSSVHSIPVGILPPLLELLGHEALGAVPPETELTAEARQLITEKPHEDAPPRRRRSWRSGRTTEKAGADDREIAGGEVLRRDAGWPDLEDGAGVPALVGSTIASHNATSVLERVDGGGMSALPASALHAEEMVDAGGDVLIRDERASASVRVGASGMRRDAGGAVPMAALLGLASLANALISTRPPPSAHFLASSSSVVAAPGAVRTSR